jgi:hypothetical protein
MHLSAQFARVQLNILGLSFFLLLAPAFAFAGSQTYSTPGTYTFTVPSYATLTTTVNGAGGGGAGGGTDAICFSSCSGTNGSSGGNSSFNGAVFGNGGTGGTAGTVNQDGGIQNGSNGSAGTASGGDSNTTGGGAGDGAGGTGYAGSENGGAGGAGGSAVKTFSSGALSQGASITVVVGAGGTGGAAGYPGYSTAGTSGSDGSIIISWTSPPAPTAILTQSSETTTAGQSFTLSWSSSNATSCTGTNFSTSGLTSGSVSASPTSNTTYSLSCAGAGGTVNESVSHGVVVVQPSNFYAYPTSGQAPLLVYFTLTNGSGSNLIYFGDGAFATNWSYDSDSNSYFISHTYQNAGTYTASVTSQGQNLGATVTVSGSSSALPTCSVTFAQNPLPYGSQTTLSYASSNATSFYINNIGYVGASGSTIVGPLATTDYSGTVSDGNGNVASCPATLTVTPPSAPTATIAASSTSIYVGQSTSITATFAPGSGDTLTADNIDEPLGTGRGADTNPGSKSITFTSTSPGTYTFYARATTQYYTSWTTYAQTSVTVTAAPKCSISLSPSTIAQGQFSTLQYSSSNATSFSIRNVGSLTPDTSGSTSVAPSQTTDYTGTASAGGVQNTCPASLTVSCTPAYSCSGHTIQRTDSSCNVINVATCVAPAFCSAGSSVCLYPPPQFNSSGQYSGHLQVNPSILPEGSTTTVHWNISNVASCSVTGSNGDSWSGATGSHTSAAITQQTNYTLSCTGLDGSSINESQMVDVVPLFQER